MRNFRALVYLRPLVEQFRLTWQLFHDPRTPSWMKWSSIGVLFYILMPVDIIPDFIPILGQLDDLGLLLSWMKLLERLTPTVMLTEIRARLRRDEEEDIIDGGKLKG